MTRTCVRVAAFALLLIGGALRLGHTVAHAQEMDLFRAEDGTAYQVIRVDPAVTTGNFQVTTVGGSSTGVGGCSQSGATIKDPVSAVAGVNPSALEVLHPFDQIMSTPIFAPPTVGVLSFDQHSGGRVTFGSGSGAVAICRDPLDCAGAPSVQPVDSPLGVNFAPACIANGVSAGCDGGITRNVFAFGLIANGDPPVCTSPVSTDTTVCAPAPSDGFTVLSGTAVVIVYDTSLAGLPFSAGVGGFLISEDASTAPCFSANEVLAAVSEVKFAKALPTETPTATPKPGHGPLSSSSNASITANCIAKCRAQTSTVADFLVCQASCPRGKKPTPTRTPIIPG